MSGITLIFLFALAQATSTQRCSKTEGSYISGHDNVGMTTTDTEDECAAHCWATKGCQFYNYGDNTACFMKKDNTCNMPTKGYRWGSRECGKPNPTSEVCSRAMNSYILGGDMGHSYVTRKPTEADCAAHCWAIEGCQFYVYYSGHCFPKTSSDKTVPAPGATWGSRECGNPTDMLTTTTKTPPISKEGCSRTEGSYICNDDSRIPGTYTNTPTEDECAAECWALEECQFYNYVHTSCIKYRSNTCNVLWQGSSWGSRECGNPNPTEIVEGCERGEAASILGGDMGYTYNTNACTEVDCAAHCWALEACQFYVYYNGYCIPKTSSNKTVPAPGAAWGSRKCGAPTDA